jgi:two-component system sensor histidine kinase YesM
MAMFVSFIFIAYITRPIITLQRFMKRVEKGDFNVQMSIKRRDEIGDLSKGFNSMVTEIRKLIHSEYNLRILRKEAELNALQAQINPHFLYNTLDSLRGIAIYERAYKAASMVENLSYLLRYSLNKDGYVVTLAAEIENVKKYVDIQNLRFNNKYDIIFEVEPSFMDVRILRLTLQPIVENSIIHGLEGKKGKGRIIVKVSSIEDNIIIEVIDDGLGMDDQKLTEVNQHLRSENIGHSIVKGGKVGIFNVNERIKHYFGDKYGIEISSIKGKGTEVRIKIPFLKS